MDSKPGELDATPVYHQLFRQMEALTYAQRLIWQMAITYLTAENEKEAVEKWQRTGAEFEQLEAAMTQTWLEMDALRSLHRGTSFGCCTTPLPVTCVEPGQETHRYSEVAKLLSVPPELPTQDG